MTICTPETFDYIWFYLLPYQTRPQGNQKTKQQKRYKDIITAFDIETTRLPGIEQSIMYVWQMCFGKEFCVIGRTWDEFLSFRARLTQGMGDSDYLVTYVHNLSYEFQFLRGVWEFAPEEVFAIKSRKILKATMGQVEMRCSYIHSNMSLDEYTRKMGVQHKKLTGSFDYDKLRYPWTPLTDEEIAYCIHDVVGLVEALTVEMAHDGDNLYTIPLTSTGYVRRDAKDAMRKASHSLVKTQLPGLAIYQELREAFRGGDTHANRFYTGQICGGGLAGPVHRADRSSSYPDIQCNNEFPMSAFYQVKGAMSLDDVMNLILVKKKAVLMRVRIYNLHLIYHQYPAPYLSRDKCRDIVNGYYDNGRILEADYLECTLTDVDLRIVVREYDGEFEFFDVAYARYGKLPVPLVEETISYYRAKTELKNVAGQEIYYLKSKNKLNSIYGMMAQNPCKRSIIYTQHGKIDKYGALDYYPEDDTKTDGQILDKYNKTAFLCYQWGCWVTAWARYRLREAIWTIIEQGGTFLYCDTDSVYYMGNVDFSAYNEQRIRDSKRSGARATDPKGIEHYMGVLEPEGDIFQFVTQGAKKYCYIDFKAGEPVVCCTIAGVGKEAGAIELAQAGGLPAFREGFTFHEAGGLEAVYNDAPTITEIEIDGHTLPITSNVVLRPSTYTVGLAADYSRLLAHRTSWTGPPENYC